MKNETMLSKSRLGRIRAQGYISESDQHVSDMAFGIRFPYRLCVVILIAAIVTKSVVLFSVMFFIAFMGVALPNHPFDYLYNYGLSARMNKPKLPPRANQLKFACTIATIWLSTVVYFLAAGSTTTGLIMAGMLAGVALLPSTIDLCIPSVIYNAIFQKQGDNTQIKIS